VRKPRFGHARSISVLRYSCVEIHESARKHAIPDEDIRHAVDHAVAVAELGDGRTLHLGPDRAENFLELIVQERIGMPPLVIHAMRMRSQYQRYLRRLGDNDA
jgi:hypothetical protein